MGQLELVPPQVTFPGGTGRYQLPPTRQMYDPNPYRRRRLFERNISDLELKVLRQAQKENPDLYNITEGIRDDVAMDMLFKQQMEKIYQEKLSEKPTKDVYDTITEKPAELPKLLEPQEPLEPGMDQKLTEPSIEIDEQTQRDREIEELIEQLDQESTADDKAADDKSAEDQSRQQEFESSIPKMDHQTVLRMMYPYKTYKEYAKAKVNTYITLGDGFMKQGKFYKADDAYALALVYDFDSAQAYGGRGLALFAAGEYLTCVRYIEKALSLAPQYAKKKIDLKTFVGMEIIDKRLAHILKWYDSSKSPDFILLASYIYYHLGDLKMASESLDLAAEKMAGSAAIDAMRNAIKSAQTGKR
jgi:tetratricopeptide (TPR) repeat protein